MRVPAKPTPKERSPLFVVSQSDSGRRRRRLWTWLLGIGLGLLILLTVVVVLAIVYVPSGQRARSYVISRLEERYNARVELREFDIKFWPNIKVSGAGLVIRRHGQEQLPPFLSIDRFSGQSNLSALLDTPWHVRHVRLEGLKINIPPRGPKSQRAVKRKRFRLPGFVIDEMQADGTQLQILTSKPGKLPLYFDIHRLSLQSVGRDRHLSFQAALRNPKPPGEIQSQGNFGPWNVDDPSLTPVSGKYVFENADLSVFKGISGILSSRGEYNGMLEKIGVRGWTDIPDFAVGLAGNPVHLKTDFQAIVDGTDGDTYLQPVTAHLLGSTIVSYGKVEGRPGVKGKTVLLDVSINQGRLEDLLKLVVKSKASPMTGEIRMHTLFRLPPGEREIVDKLFLKGNFSLLSARFSNVDIQRHVESLSRHGRGLQPEDKTGSVVSNLRGQFQLQSATMSFSQLSFEVPGGAVLLHGRYGLKNEQMGFRGELRLQARVSQTTHGIKSLLLKPLDPLFHRHGAGTWVPIRIEGTRSNPHFGLEVGRLMGQGGD